MLLFPLKGVDPAYAVYRHPNVQSSDRRYCRHQTLVEGERFVIMTFLGLVAAARLYGDNAMKLWPLCWLPVWLP